MPLNDVEKIIRKEPLEDYYDVGNELGRGKFAIVKKCTEKSSGDQFADKVLKKRRRGKSCREDILAEIDIMRQANEAREHTRIIKLHEVFESSKEFHIILELATGGELFRVIAIDPLSEEKAREVVHQIVDGVQHLHSLSIVHLDLKPENILLYRKGQLDIKIADFGLSVQVKAGQEMKTLVGTAEYVSPEILNFEPLSIFTDMWSIGALTYALLTGYSPFQGETHQETFLNVSQCDYDFDDEVFDVVSSEAKEFIELLLVHVPRKRMSAIQCLEHPWMKARKQNLNSSTTSLDSALCMDSPSSVEPSPASSTSSSFSPAPSNSTTSNTVTTSTVTASSSSSTSYSQPEDMRKVHEKLSQISTLATERHIAETPPKAARGNSSPTGTDSSSSTLREDGSIESLSSLVNDAEMTPRDAKADTSKGRDALTAKVRKASPPSALKGSEPLAQSKWEPLSRADAIKSSALDKTYRESSRKEERDASQREKVRIGDVRTSTVDTELSGKRERAKRDGTDGVESIRASYSTSSSRASSRGSSRNSSLETKDFIKADKKYATKYLADSGKDLTGDTSKFSSSYLPEGRSTTRDYSSRSATLGRYSSYGTDSTYSRSGTTKDVSKLEVIENQYKSTTLNRSRRETNGSKPLSQENDSSLAKRRETATSAKTSQESTEFSKASKSGNSSTLITNNALKVLSPKIKHKHRPVTPEPLSPDITDTKLLHSPDLRKRRKSEGMKPIPLWRGAGDVKKSETLLEEDRTCLSPVGNESAVSKKEEVVDSSSSAENVERHENHNPDVDSEEKRGGSGSSSPTKRFSPVTARRSRNGGGENLRYIATTTSPTSKCRNLGDSSESPSRTKTFSSENLRYIATTTSPTLHRNSGNGSESPGRTKTFSSENVRYGVESIPTETGSHSNDAPSKVKPFGDSATSSPTETTSPSSQITPRQTLTSENLRYSPTTSRRSSRNDGSSSPTKATTFSRENARLDEATSSIGSRSRYDSGMKAKTLNHENSATPRYDSSSFPTKAKTLGHESVNTNGNTSSTDSIGSRYEGCTSPTKSKSFGHDSTRPNEDSRPAESTCLSSRDRNDRSSSPSKLGHSDHISSVTTPPSFKSKPVSTSSVSRPVSSGNTSPTPPSQVTVSSNQTKDASRPSSRNSGKATKPPSPTLSKPSKYSSCTENAFTSNNSPFMAEETRPYTSVLRRSNEVARKDLTPASKSFSSLIRSPADQVWRESGGYSTSSRKLSANPVRGRPLETINDKYSPTPGRSNEKGSDGGRTSTSPTKVYPTSSYTLKDEEGSGFSSFKDKQDTKQSLRSSSPNGHLISPQKSPVCKSPPFSRRAFVQREQTLLDKTDLAVTPLVEREVSKPHSILDLESGPEIVVRSPSITATDKAKAAAKRLRETSTPTDSEALSSGGVRIRPKSPNARQSRKSWRETPVIPPDVVEMILTGAFFDSESDELCPLDTKLDTCVEEDETVKKFSPVNSRTGSRAERHTPILKSSKSNSPDQSSLSSSVPEKRVSINSEPSMGEERHSRPRRKFLSADERANMLVGYNKPCSSDDRSSPPAPDLLSVSMDMRRAGSRFRSGSLSHSISTPDLTEILADTKKGAKAKRVERSNSKRMLGRSRNDTYLDSTQISMDMPTSPRHRSGTMSFSPRHTAGSITNRILTGTGINRAFSSFRKSERESSSESRNKGTRTLK